MGIGMATNLQNHLSKIGAPSLRYHNRTMSRGEPLQALGASPSASIRQLLAETDTIFLSLSNDAALEATLDALIEAEEELASKVIVDTSTVHPDASYRAQERLAEHGAHFVAAPVFGASPVAAQGQLLWVVAGPQIAVRAITPFLVGVMARVIINLGGDVRQASLLKTAGYAPPSLHIYLYSHGHTHTYIHTYIHILTTFWAETSSPPA